VNPLDDPAAFPYRLQNLEARARDLDKEMDTKADKTDIADLRKQMQWVTASLFAIALALVTAAITVALTVGGGG
jgi:membrane protein required for beta-lactamase induction